MTTFRSCLAVRELVLTTHESIICLDTVSWAGEVKLFEDTAIVQESIEPDEFFYRFSCDLDAYKPGDPLPLEVRCKCWSVNVDFHKGFLQGYSEPCLCGDHYAPDSRDVQRSCRWCKSWYHETCLEQDCNALSPEERQSRLDAAAREVAKSAVAMGALAPIRRGADDIVGNVMPAYEVFAGLWEDDGDDEEDDRGEVQHVAQDGPAWAGIQMYACPKCTDGFL
jgi:hypothetical protein